MKRFLYFILICLIALVVITGLALWGAIKYLESDDEKVIRNIPFLNQGELRFNEVDIHLFDTYPEASFTIQNAELFSPDKSYEKPVLIIDSLTGFVEIKNLWKRSIVLDEIHLSEGNLYSVTDTEGNSNLGSLLKGNNSNSGGGNSFINFTTNPNSRIQIQNFLVHQIDSTKQKNLKIMINDLTSDIQLTKEDTSFQYSADVYSEHLTFNWLKGPYLENSHISIQKGSATIENGIVTIPESNVVINEYNYKIGATIYPKNSEENSLLTIRNDSSDFQEIRSLLTTHIQDQLSKYNVGGQFKTDADILFVDPVNPIATIQFQVNNNPVSVKNKTFVGTNATGFFRNRKYLDERALNEGKKNLHLHFDQLETTVDGFHVNSTEGTITYTPVENAQIYFPAKIRGKAKQISQYFTNEPYRFVNGDVKIDATLEGSLVNTINIINDSDAKVEINDLEFLYEPSGVRFPFDFLKIDKRGSFADFTMAGSTPVTQNNFEISGEIEHFTDIFKEKEKKTQSKIQFRAQEFSWKDFSNLFGTNGYLSNGEDKKDSVQTESKSTQIRSILSSLESKFQPELDAKIDRIQYNSNLSISDFSTNLEFEDNQTLKLNSTQFYIDTSLVRFDGKIDYHQPETSRVDFELEAHHLNLEKILPQVNYFNIELLTNFPQQPEDLSLDFNFTGRFNNMRNFELVSAEGDLEFESEKNEIFTGHVIFAGDIRDSLRNIKTTASVHAEPKIINNLFENSNYAFQKGELDVLLQYEGYIESLEELIANSDIELAIEDSQIEDINNKVKIPIDEFVAIIRENDANINLSIQSDTLSHLTIDADVTKISDLIYNNNQNNHSVDVDVYSPLIEWENFQSIFARNTTDTTSFETDSTSKTIAVKESVLNAMKSFNPTVDLTIDQLTYMDDVEINEIKSSIALKDTSILVVDNTGFRYLTGNVELEAEAVLNNEKIIPFKGELKSNDFKLAQLLEEMDYLDIDALESTEELDGIIDIDMELEGVYDENKQKVFDENTTAEIEFSLREARLKGMPVVDTLARKILQKNRFEDIEFAPIESTVHYNKGIIEIPFTEIQSNAIHLFVEAGETTNDKQSIWFTIPLRMILHPGFECVPEKTGNSEGRNRLFIELLENEEGELKTKFHISKKKFFEQRGREEDFEDYRQKMKEERKQRRRERRKEQ